MIDSGGTRAVPIDLIGYNEGDQPLCPSCIGGRLHPYGVTIGFPKAVGKGVHYTSERADWLEGWVAVCVGNRNYRDYMSKVREEQLANNDPEPVEVDGPIEPCGFSMPMTPHSILARL